MKLSLRNHVLPVLPLALSVFTAGSVLASYGRSETNGKTDLQAPTAASVRSVATSSSRILPAPSASTSK